MAGYSSALTHFGPANLVRANLTYVFRSEKMKCSPKRCMYNINREEREREKERERMFVSIHATTPFEHCVCVRERKRGREREFDLTVRM